MSDIFGKQFVLLLREPRAVLREFYTVGRNFSSQRHESLKPDSQYSIDNLTDRSSPYFDEFSAVHHFIKKYVKGIPLE